MGTRRKRRPKQRVAAIDVGSNTVHLLVGVVQGDRVRHVDDTSAFLKLGEHVEEQGSVTPKKLDALEQAVREYVAAAVKLGATEVLVGATGAIREASNSAEVMRRLTAAATRPARLLTAEAEARLTFLGVRAELRPRGVQVVFDSGGASTELIVARGRKRVAAYSLALGSSALQPRLTGDPPWPLEWARLAAEIASDGRSLPEHIDAASGLATGGAAHRFEELLGKSRVTSRDLELLAREALSAPAQELAERESQRAEKIRQLPIALLIYDFLLRRTSLRSLRVSRRGLRDGMILAHARRPDAWWRASDV